MKQMILLKVKSLINSFLNNYQKKEQVLRDGSNFIFESVDLMSDHIHKTSQKRGNSYIKSPEWVANKKAIINPKNPVDHACFLYSIVVALNHQNIRIHPDRIRIYYRFINQYNWKDIELPPGIKDWKNFEKK